MRNKHEVQRHLCYSKALKVTNETNEMCLFRGTFPGSRILFYINFRVSGTQKKKAMQVHAVLFHAFACIC